MSIFAERLRTIRKMKNLSQSQVGEAIGISRGMLSNYEINNRQPDFSTLILLADFYNVSIDYLLGIIDTYKPYEKYSPLEADLINNILILSSDGQFDVGKYIDLILLREGKHKSI